MKDKLIYLALGVLAGAVLFFVFGPKPSPEVYTEYIVHEIQGEPQVEIRWREKIVYRDREPEVTVTQPGGAEDTVEDFCRPDTVRQIIHDTVTGQTDTVYVARDSMLLLRSGKMEDGWFPWNRDLYVLYGVMSNGDLTETRFRSYPGWQWTTDGPRIVWRESRFGWIKPTLPYMGVAGLFYLAGSVFGG